MSDEQNLQPENDNKNQELSEEELNDVAGGWSWGANQTLISSYNQPALDNTFTGGVKPPSISSSTIDGIKGES